MAASASSLYAPLPQNNASDLSFLDYALILLAKNCQDAADMDERSATKRQSLTQVYPGRFSRYTAIKKYETLTTTGEDEDCFP